MRKFWEDNDVAQIEGIVVDGTVRNVGLATFVYETVASKVECYFAQYYPFDGERVCYDGKSIPESEIWSEHPDRSKHGVVLVTESITGKAA